MQRRTLIASIAATSLSALPARAEDGFVDTRDGQRLFYKDVGRGKPVVFIHGWSLSAAIWDGQTDWLATQGQRAIAYDRRGHGRSTKPTDGYDYDTLADDLAALLERLDLRDVTLVGHSMGGGEVARYFARHGGKRIARVMLVAPTTPFTLKTADNPEGTDRQVFDQLIAALEADPARYMAAGAPSLLGKDPSPETVQWALRIASQASTQALAKCIRSLSETDFRPDMHTVAVPTLIVYGSSDLPSQVSSARRTATTIAGSRLEIYEGAPHGLFITDRERFNQDLLRFARS